MLHDFTKWEKFPHNLDFKREHPQAMWESKRWSGRVGGVQIQEPIIHQPFALPPACMI